MEWPSVFGQRQDAVFSDFSSLVTDLHSHIIPGIDDGSASVEESLQMIRGMQELGYRKLILTPHVMSGFADNTPQTIRNGFDRIIQAVASAKLEMELFAAAEYMVDDEFARKVRNDELLSFGNKHLLLELSTYYPHPLFKSLVFDLNVAGYTVVMAHAERYTYWFNDLSVFEELKSGGVLIQSNIVSFAGYYSPIFRKNVELLAEAGLIDILGSDLHKPATLALMREALSRKSLQKLMASGSLLNNVLTGN